MIGQHVVACTAAVTARMLGGDGCAMVVVAVLEEGMGLVYFDGAAVAGLKERVITLVWTGYGTPFTLR